MNDSAALWIAIALIAFFFTFPRRGMWIDREMKKNRERLERERLERRQK